MFYMRSRCIWLGAIQERGARGGAIVEQSRPCVVELQRVGRASFVRTQGTGT